MRTAVAALAVLIAVPATAQQTVEVRQGHPAWLGISYEVQWVHENGACAPRIVVETVVQGSPAERAGLRAGDAILSLDGRPLPGGQLQVLAAALTPGDSVRLRVLRDGRHREVTAVADRRPDRPVSIFIRRATGGFQASTAPVIEVDGDRLIARNLETSWSPARARSYWLTREDGRSEYRSLTGRLDPLDRRAEELLACADSVRRADGSVWVEPSGVRVNLQRLQERADSLRVIMTQRALSRQEGEEVRVRVRPDEVRETREPSAVLFTSPDGVYTFRVEDHVAVGLRGVAGAELTALEPELAEYFRNANRGLLVLRIAPDTPADRAGLVPGDVVIAADGRRIDSVAELRRILALPEAGGVELRVIRKGRTRDLTLPRS